ncbi:alginate export family protein [bacterium]|nr:alginate export family protein [bacterium]
MISVNGIDVSVRTYGLSAVGVYEQSGFKINTLLWAVVQQGNWYELAHKAFANAIEGGFQWPKSRWKPWFRLGLNQSSGDSNPDDGDHKTFFAMFHSKDFFTPLILKPNPRMQVRLDYHRLHLTESADRWYTGGGATANTGTVNGFTARASGGETDLGRALELIGSYIVEKNC